MQTRCNAETVILTTTTNPIYVQEWAEFLTVDMTELQSMGYTRKAARAWVLDRIESDFIVETHCNRATAQAKAIKSAVWAALTPAKK